MSENASSGAAPGVSDVSARTPEQRGRRRQEVARTVALKLVSGTARALASRMGPPRIMLVWQPYTNVVEGHVVDVEIRIENFDEAWVYVPGEAIPRPYREGSNVTFVAVESGAVLVEATNAVTEETVSARSNDLRVQPMPVISIGSLAPPELQGLSGEQVQSLVEALRGSFSELYQLNLPLAFAQVSDLVTSRAGDMPPAGDSLLMAHLWPVDIQPSRRLDSSATGLRPVRPLPPFSHLPDSQLQYPEESA
jgi:hypothetical protein